MLKNLRWYQRILVFLVLGIIVLGAIAKLIAYIAYSIFAVAFGALVYWWIRRAYRKRQTT